MNNVSWRHHYLPEFYLKGFTNQEGKFKIFDIERQVFIRNGKDFSPESYFYEEDGNTVHNDKGPDDFIENRFGDIDSQVAALFNKLKGSNADVRFGLSESDMPALQYFVSILFWRIPSNYDQIRKLINENDLHRFGLSLRSRETGEVVRDEEMENRIRHDPNFFKVVKLILPNITYPRLLDCRTPLTIQPFPEQLPALCSDNPLIFERPNPDIYHDDFIFPLSHKLVFFRANQINGNTSVQIKVVIDQILLKQAKKYVSCTDMLYVQMLNNLNKKDGRTLEDLKEYVFETLIVK